MGVSLKKHKETVPEKGTVSPQAVIEKERIDQRISQRAQSLPMGSVDVQVDFMR